MKHLFILIAALFILTSSFAQEEIISVDYIENEYIDSTVLKQDHISSRIKKIDFGVDVGMAYLFSSNGAGGPLVSLSPYITYPVGNRTSFTAGAALIHGTYSSPYYLEGGNAFLPMTRMYLYGSVNYQLTQRLTTYAAVYTEVIDVPNTDESNQFNASSATGYGVTAGFHYKITPSISFSAQVRMDKPGYRNMYAPARNPYARDYTPNWW